MTPDFVTIRWSFIAIVRGSVSGLALLPILFGV